MRRSYAPSRTSSGSPLLQAVLQKTKSPDLFPTRSPPLIVGPCSSNRLGELHGEVKTGRYFTVLWAKASTKKHKTWEGDATMVICGREVTVTDEKDNVIATTSAIPLTKLAVIANGDRLMVGGKEIEIQEELSGRPLRAAISPGSSSPIGMNSLLTSGKASTSPGGLTSPSVKATESARKPFVIPLKDPKSISANFYVGPKGARPCQEPIVDLDPDAIVMPRPSLELINQLGHEQSNVNDVIVDPVVCRHLRPHQVEGVLFLYECMIGLRKPPSATIVRATKLPHGYLEEDADLFGDDPVNDHATYFKFSSRNRYGAILADDMGLGKSLQTIATLWTLFKQGPFGNKPVIQRVLLVCPSSLIKQWVKEFHKWLGASRLRVMPVTKSPDLHEFMKFQGSAVEVNVLVISYELAAKSIDRFESVGFDLLVCDEAHRLRNATIKANLVLSGLKIPRIILLSGTPVQNNLMELHALCDFIYPGIFGSTSAFKRSYEDPIAKGHKPDSTLSEKQEANDRTADLLTLTSHFLLRRTQEVNQKYLTAKIEFVLFCQPSELQTTIYQKVLARNFSIAEDGGFQSGGTKHLMVIDVLKKLCSHPVMLFQTDLKSNAVNDTERSEMKEECSSKIFDNSMFPDDFTADGVSVIDSGKLATTCAILQNLNNQKPTGQPKEKVVVVSNYVQTLNLLESLCDASGFSYYRLDGSTPSDDRLTKVNKFNSPSDQTFVFLLSSKAGGVGLNLVGASRLILFDIDWNPANDLQAMARIWRDGQTKPVFIYRLLTTGTIEEKIFQRQIKKQGLTSAVVKKSTKGKLADSTINTDFANASATSVTSFTNAELRDLFTLHQNTQCQTHDVIHCGCQGNGGLVTNKSQSPVSPPTVVGGDCSDTGDIGDLSAVCDRLGNEENKFPHEPTVSPPVKKKKKMSNDTQCDLDVSMAQLRQWAHYSANHVDTEACFASSALDNCSIFLTWVFMLENSRSASSLPARGESQPGLQ